MTWDRGTNPIARDAEVMRAPATLRGVQDDRPLDQFRIATWNVHMGLHNDGGRNDVVTGVKELDADIVVLQEAWWYGEADSELADQVARAMGGELYRYTSPTPMRLR